MRQVRDRRGCTLDACDREELYRAQKKEMRHLQKTTHPFERAVFVFSQRDRLSNGKSLTFRQMVALILKPERLIERVEAVQEQERRSIARAEKQEKKQVSERIWQLHKHKFEIMRTRQAQERMTARSEREQQLQFVVTFDLAKESLLAERRSARSEERHAPEPASALHNAEAFNTSVNTRSPTQMERVEAIKQQMQEWRRRHMNRDFGNEL